MLLLSLALAACPAPVTIPGLLSSAATASADGRALYVSFETSSPTRVQARGDMRIESSGFGLFRVRGEGIALERRGDTLTFRCAAPSASRAFAPLLLGTIEVPQSSADEEWRRAERLFQKEDPRAREAYLELSKNRLTAYASLRLADLALLSGAEADAYERYRALAKKAPREAAMIAAAMRDELALRRGERPAPLAVEPSVVTSTECAYRLAHYALARGAIDEAETLLTGAYAVQVGSMRNLGLLERIRADRVREAYLAGDDASVALAAASPVVMPLVLHALLSLDEPAAVLERVTDRDRALAPLAIVAFDAELDLGRCEDARAHAPTLPRDERLAPRLKRLAAPACGKEKP